MSFSGCGGEELWGVNDASTVSLPPPLVHALRNCVCVSSCVFCVCAQGDHISESVNWTVNIRGVRRDYHNVRQITDTFVY